MSESGYSIKLAARRTGLSAHTIRVWEKRYSAIHTTRTSTNRRVYTDSTINRLTLLRNALQAGHTISNIATLSDSELSQLSSQAKSADQFSISHADNPDALLADCIRAVKQLDARLLEQTLSQGSLALGGQGLLLRVIAPLAHQIGELWRNGTITASHEHFASTVIKVFLVHAASSFSAVEGAPVILVATPTGQLHELGALLAASTAANLGWRIVYLGASLPAAEIAGAAIQSHARAVALSIVYPEDDPHLGGEIARLRELLPAEIPILIGGRAMPAYGKSLEKTGVVQIGDLNGLCSILEKLRKPSGRWTP